MKFLLLILALTGLQTLGYGQTKLIAHRSHSGVDASFKMHGLHNLGCQRPQLDYTGKLKEPAPIKVSMTPTAPVVEHDTFELVISEADIAPMVGEEIVSSATQEADVMEVREEVLKQVGQKVIVKRTTIKQGEPKPVLKPTGAINDLPITPNPIQSNPTTGPRKTNEQADDPSRGRTSVKGSLNSMLLVLVISPILLMLARRFW